VVDLPCEKYIDHELKVRAWFSIDWKTLPRDDRASVEVIRRELGVVDGGA
jgi:hypothetical protein